MSKLGLILFNGQTVDEPKSNTVRLMLLLLY